MPALPPVAKVVRIRLIGGETSDLNLGSHYTLSYTGAAPTVAQLGTFATQIGTQWATNLAPLAPAEFTLNRVEVVDLTSPTSAVVEQPVTHAGTRAGTPLPLNCCFTLRFGTALRRRGGHWHAQLRLGVQADTATAQDWSSTFVTAVVNAWSTFGGAVATFVWPGGGTLAQVGVQYYGPPNRTHTSGSGRVTTVSTPLAVPVTYPVTAYGAGTRIGSQRRRLGKQTG